MISDHDLLWRLFVLLREFLFPVLEDVNLGSSQIFGYSMVAILVTNGLLGGAYPEWDGEVLALSFAHLILMPVLTSCRDDGGLG